MMITMMAQFIYHSIKDQFSSTEFASIIHGMVGGKSRIIHKDAMEDDPQRRKPDITRANTILGWQPLVGGTFASCPCC